MSWTDAAYAVECAAVVRVDLPRLEQYVSELEQRVGWLEQRFWPRFSALEPAWWAGAGSSGR